ncbi:MAG: hypothetical protein HYV45_01075 [Candidatus Moranbacteria bacterium]|nr:hypothetical protein [Candidatus Moranbacteria bacterium]
MEQKPWLKIVLGIVLVAAIFFGAYWLGSRKTSDDTNTLPTAQTTGEKEKKDTSAPTPTPTKNDSPSEKENIDDIVKKITDDVSGDQNTLTEETTGEISSLDTGSKIINDLGQSYDEDEY